MGDKDWPPLPNPSSQSTHNRNAVERVSDDSGQTKFRAMPSWLRSLSALARQDLLNDLSVLKEKFALMSADLVPLPPARIAVDIAGTEFSVEAARQELVEGILQYYATQVEWNASEMPVEEPASPKGHGGSSRETIG